MKRDDLERGDCHSCSQSTSPTTSSSPSSPLTDRSTARSFRVALQGIQSALPSRVTRLTLVGYVLVMGEWLQLMQLLPALQHLDIHIISISSSENTVSRPEDTMALQEQVPEHQYQSMLEMGEMATGISHITLYQAKRSARAESRSPSGQSDKDDYESRRHDDILVDTGMANRDHSSDTFVPGASFTLDRRQCRHSRDRNRAQDHVAEEGKSEGAESFHDMRIAVEVEDFTCNNLSRRQREEHIQFMSVRSVVFRGGTLSAEMLAYLPRLESLSFAQAPVILGTSSPSPCTPSSQSMSRLVDVADTLMNKCPGVTHLLLSEPSIVAGCVGGTGWASHLPSFMGSMPRLEHFMTSTQIMATHGTDVVSALLEYHSQRLKSFRVIALHPSFVLHRHRQKQSESMKQLSDTSLGASSEDNNTSHTPSASFSEGSTTYLAKQQCLRVLESCPRLETFECQIDLLMQDVIASASKWSCHDSIKVLALEVQELFNDCSVEEVAVMDMFIKTLLRGSHPLSPREGTKRKHPSIIESDALSSPSISIPSTTSTDTLMSSSSSLGTVFPPSASSSLSAPEHAHSTLLHADPITSPPLETSETSPLSTCFPSRRHAEALLTTCGEDMGTSVDEGEVPKAHTLKQHDSPPLPATLPEHCRANYPVQAVGRLVSLQYLVEQQLSKLASLDRLSLGQTVYPMPRV